MCKKALMLCVVLLMSIFTGICFGDYDDDPCDVIPSVDTLIPPGHWIDNPNDEWPVTLDLAKRGYYWLRGMSQCLSTEPNNYLAPYGHVKFYENPTVFDFQIGPPNWGKIAQGLVMARKMYNTTEYLDRQLDMMRNMIDIDVNMSLLSRGYACWNVYPHRLSITNMTTTIEALMELYRQSPVNAMRSQILDLSSYQADYTLSDPAGHYYPDDPYYYDNGQHHIGVLGYYMTVFMNGKAARSFFDCWDLFEHTKSYNMGDSQNNFISQSIFWDGSTVGPYYGHVHSYLNGLMGLLWQAEVDQDDNLRDLVKSGYEFTRDTVGNGEIGMFGEGCATGDMIRLAIKLTQCGAADYWEDVDKYVRNGLAELQISDKNLSYLDPDSVHGTFMSDGTHIMGIPGGEPFQWAVCCEGNLMHGLYDAWKNILEFKGDFIQVNLLLNRTSEYCQVKSDLPYRGTCSVITKANLTRPDGTTITKIGIRIPEWVDKQQVTLWRAGSVDTNWSWISTNYVYIENVTPSTSYTVQFPLVIRNNVPVSVTWSTSDMWQESNKPSSSWPVATNTYYCKFRGNTLASCSNRPSVVYPYFIRTELENLPDSEVVPPYAPRAQWVLGEESLIGEIPIPTLDIEPSISYGTTNTVSWSDVTDTDEYYVECAEDDSFTTNVKSSGWITGLSYEFSGLRPDQQHWFRVKSRNAYYESLWSDSETTLQKIYPDYNSDDFVDETDFGYFAEKWLDTGCDGSSGDASDWCWSKDMNGDGEVDLEDFAMFAQNWLTVIPVLFDNFNDGDYNGWKIVDEGSTDAPSEWSVVNGEMVQSSNIHSGSSFYTYGTYAYYDDGFAWDDYTLKLKMRSSDNEGIGVLFRYQSSSNYYKFSWNSDQTYRRLVKKSNGIFTVIAEDSVPYVTGQDYNLEISAVGNNIAVKIDGATIFSETDSDLSSGTIALYSWGNQNCYFDDVTVTD
jgi:hypothetical protein